jgi:predicted metal-dependent phosphoesterase TrpH
MIRDLHSHSTASDGVLSPSNLVDYACEHGVTTLALTDHDTLDGLDEGAARALDKGIRFIPGIELTGTCVTGTLHILGLSIQDRAPLETLVLTQQEERLKRNNKIIAVMQAAGVEVTLEAVERVANTKSLGRPHFADYLVHQGIVKTRQAAFDKYLGRGKPWYFEHVGVDPKDAIQAILASGAVPILAHPLSLYLSWGKLPGAIDELCSFGLAGLEAWHPSAREKDCRRLETLAREKGLLVTAGSDFHEPPGKTAKATSHRKSTHTPSEIGHTAGGRVIDEGLVSFPLNHIE